MSEPTKPIKTAGEIHNFLRNQPEQNLSPLELADQFCIDTYKGVVECIGLHYDVFSPQLAKFCVVCSLCHGEGGLKYLIRRKFCALPFLPSPYPNQSVWMFDKNDDSVTFLWSLPEPSKMAFLSESFSYMGEEDRMKKWCDWFFKGAQVFWENIRKMHGIDMLSEMEINRRNREVGNKYIDDDVSGLDPNTSYLPDLWIKKVETVGYAERNQPSNNVLRESN